MDKPDDDTPDLDAFKPGEIPRKADLDNKPPVSIGHIMEINGRIETVLVRLADIEEALDLIKLRLDNVLSKLERWNS